MKQPFRSMLAGIAVTGCLLCSAETVNVVTVNKMSGEPVHFLVSESPQTRFSNEEVTIKTGTQELKVPLEDFKSIALDTQDRINTGIENIYKGHGLFSVTDVMLEASGMKVGSEVAIYDMTGIARARKIADADGVVAISIEDLMPGVYVVATELSNFKFVKR